MVTWAIQHNLLNVDQITAITDAVKASGASCTHVGVIPFTEEISGADEIQGDLVIPYGSTGMTKRAASLGWKGLFFNPLTFRVDQWNANRDDMLNSDAVTTTVEGAKVLLKDAAPDDVYFIRPMEDLKAFNGTVTTVENIVNWMNSVESGSFNFEPHTQIVIAHEKNILAEWRWFVVGGKVIDGSTYKIRNQRLTKHEQDADVIAEAQTFADKWLPHDTCVMDLALTDDGVKVIEFNCINSTGFYYNDIPAIVLAMNERVLCK